MVQGTPRGPGLKQPANLLKQAIPITARTFMTHTSSCFSRVEQTFYELVESNEGVECRQAVPH